MTHSPCRYVEGYGTAWARIQARITVDAVSGCWLWTGPRNPNGYAQIWVGSKRDGTHRIRYIHRVTYLLAVGPIPEGMHLDHLCRTRHCCNPDHLEVVTPRENVLRGESRAATHARATECVNGHPFDEANTGYTTTGHRRRCRACHREQQRSRRSA